MSDESLREMSTKLDQLILLPATSTVRGLKQHEAISVLGEIGLERNVIARIVRTTPATVSVRLSEAKALKAVSSKSATAKKGKKRAT